MKEEVFSQIRTKEEVENLLRVIDQLLASLYQRRGRLAADLVLPEFLNKELTKFDRDHPEVTEKYLWELKKQLLNLPVVKLSLAFKPPSDLLERIVLWVRSKMEPKGILEIVVDEGVIGGAMITFNGRYQDFSLKKSLKKVFEDQKEEILRKTR
jgi:succinate dehydrogenase flavin-adding protein (antitoxin of CptAB toxin-antitoxin module)